MKLTGALTFANAHEVWAVLAPSAEGKASIDVSGVTQVDSAGLALLSALKRRAGAQCQVIGLTPKLATLASAYDVEALF
ncbi:MAG: STAS domain-containing protein [Rhizobacter sp.]|nr:STAS domain-containing protein [Burkholderiales bacterium]